MANNCFYELKAVSANKENLERLIKIMKYEDAEYFIYRCFNADADNEISEENGLYYVLISGDVAWSCTHWFETKEDEKMFAVTDYEKDVNGNIDYEKPIYGTAHYISLDLICQKLNIAVEVYSVETGCCFQEHYLVNHNGEIICDESVDYSEDWTDDDGNDLQEPVTTGGFEDYGEFSSAKEIYE